MRVLIIDQCSNSKSYPEGSVEFDASEIDDAGLDALRRRGDTVSIPARKLYAGRQQRYISGAVDSLRANGHGVDRYFISAGFGLVAENEALPPYNVTFADMTAAEIESRAESLELTERTCDVILSEPYEVIFFALGSDYYRALNLPEVLSAVTEKTIGVVFNKEEVAEQYDNIVSVPARNEQAKVHGTIVVALKGVYLKNFANNLAQGSEPTSAEDIRNSCIDEPTSQKDLTKF